MTDDIWSPKAWESQAFDGFRDLLAYFAEHSFWPPLRELESQWLVRHQVTSGSGEPLRLVPHEGNIRPVRPRNRRDLYDVSVCNGELPMRPCNWHDFFNLLVFVGFAQSKRTLHSRQCRILEERVPERVQRLPGARTREQDHLAMLDEGGVLLAVDSANRDALVHMLTTAQHGTVREFIEDDKVRPWLIGHAHLEHLAINASSKVQNALPRAKPVVLDIGVRASRDQVDGALAKRLAAPNIEFLQNDWRAVSLEHLFSGGSDGQAFLFTGRTEGRKSFE